MLKFFCLVAALVLSSCGKDVEEKEVSSSPSITSLKLDPLTGSGHRAPMTMLATCSNCVESKTQYAWYAEGSTTPVSTSHTYEHRSDANNLLKKITVHVTPVNEAGEQGQTQTTTYALNKVETIVGNGFAFAAIKTDGSVETWGNAMAGGYSEDIKSQLKNVLSITATSRAFAALRADGTVVAWGEPRDGGDSSLVDGLLQGVVNITGNRNVFAALKSDGSAVFWGGVNNADLPATLTHDVVSVATSPSSLNFAVLKPDGSVITWRGQTCCTSWVDATPTDVHTVTASYDAFAALKNDGSVITWGAESSALAGEAILGRTGFVSITSNGRGFVGLKDDGTVVTWAGQPAVDRQFDPQSLTDVRTIVGTVQGIGYISRSQYEFAALKTDGTVVSWGNSELESLSNEVSAELKEVQSITSNSFGFAALKSDGSVVTWGVELDRGAYTPMPKGLSGVKSIASTYGAFAAIKDTGEVVVWGDSSFGADTGLSQRLVNVNSVQALGSAFIAYKKGADNEVWGEIRLNMTESEVDLNEMTYITRGDWGRPFAGLTKSGTVEVWPSESFNPDYDIAKPSDVSEVVSVVNNVSSYAALKVDGSVKTWGKVWSGGDSSEVQDQLVGVTQVVATNDSFAALRSDGQVISWGRSFFDITFEQVQDELKDIKYLSSTGSTFVALTADGRIILWGDDLIPPKGAPDPEDYPWLSFSDVVSVAASGDTAAALMSDGSVGIWDQNSLEEYGQVANVKSLVDGGAKFAAINQEGQVIRLPEESCFSNNICVTDDALNNVVSVATSTNAFAALKANGSVVTWGGYRYGGDSSSVASLLTNVKSIEGGEFGFSALKEDGTVVIWGDVDSMYTPSLSVGETVLISKSF